MVLVSAIGCTLGSLNAGCRVLFAMGRHGVLHSSIGEAHKKNETPHISVSVCAGISLLIGLLTMKIWNLGPTDLLNDGGSFSAYGFIVGYVMIAIAAPVYLKKQGALTPLSIAISAAALLFLVVPIVGSFYPLPDPPVRYFPYAFGIYMLLGGAWLFVQNKRSGKVLEKIEADLEDISTRFEVGGKRPIMHGTELDGIGEASAATA